MKILDHILGYCILLLTFSISFNTILGDSKVIIAVSFLTIIKLILSYRDFKIKEFLNAYKFLLLFFAVLILGLAYSQDISKAFSVVERLLAFIIVPLIFYVNRKNKLIKYVPEAFLSGVLITALYCNLYQLIQYGHPFKFGFSKLLNTLETSTTYFSLYCLMAIIISLFYLLKRKIKSIIFHSLITVYLFFFILFLGSKTAFLALVLLSSFIFAYGLNKYFKKRYLVLLPLLIIVTLVITYIHPLTYGRFYKPIIDSDFNLYQLRLKFVGDRYYLWKCALESMTFPEIIFGYGTGDQKTTLLPCYDKYRIWQYLNPHNQYFSTIIKVGLLGLLPLLLTFTEGLHLKSNKMLYKLFSILIVLMGFTEVLLNRSKGVIFITLFSAFFITISNHLYLPKNNLHNENH